MSEWDAKMASREDVVESIDSCTIEDLCAELSNHVSSFIIFVDPVFSCKWGKVLYKCIVMCYTL